MRKRNIIIAAVLVAIPFMIGLSVRTDGYEAITWMFLVGVYGVGLGIAGGIIAICYFHKMQGGKGVWIGLLILLVLIPLGFLGTCGLSAGGSFLRSLFLR